MASTDLPYNTGPMAVTTWYRAIVKDGGCSEAPSTSVKVTVSNPVQPGQVGPDTTVCAGQSPGTLTLTGHQGTIARWEKSVAPYTAWTEIANTAATYAPGPLQQTTQFAAVISTSGSQFRSIPATVTVITMPVMGTITGPTQLCQGQQGIVFSIPAIARAISCAWTVPPGASITGKTDTAAITVDFSTAAQSGNVTVTVQTGCGALGPATHAVTVGAIAITGVSFTDPTVPLVADGKTVIRLAAGSAPGLYQIDLDDDGAYEHSASLTRDSLVVTGFRDRDTVKNVVVKPANAPCVSPVYTALHGFRAQQMPVLPIPSVSPGGGTYNLDTLRVYFVLSDLHRYAAIYWTRCNDTAGCGVTGANRQLYDSTQGILLGMQDGQEAIAFVAEPLPAYAAAFEASPVGRAMYLYRPGFQVSGAWYYDLNADGHVDAARIAFNRHVPVAPSVVTVLPPDADFLTEALRITPAPAGADTFLLSFTATPFADLATGFATDPTGRIEQPSTYFSDRDFNYADRTAPVITAATYTMASSAAGAFYHDTLRVSFSENVTVSGTAPFVFTNSSGPLSYGAMTINGSQVTIVVVIPASNTGIAPDPGDSISINFGTSRVADLQGNIQANPNNRRVRVTFIYPDKMFELQAGPTLFNPAAQSYRITMRPHQRFGSFEAGSHASLAIFDAMGGRIVTKQFENAAGILSVEWDGKNAGGRTVAQGTYLGILESEVNGAGSKRKLKIAVDRD